MKSTQSRFIASSLQIIIMLTFSGSVLGLVPTRTAVSARRLLTSCCFLSTPIARSKQRSTIRKATTNFIQWRNFQSPSCAFSEIQTTQDEDRRKQEVSTTIVNQQTQNWLVVGDGDLSYSAAVAETLLNNEDGSSNHSNSNKRIRLIASVLEDRDTHQAVYRNSRINAQRIVGPVTAVAQEPMDDEVVDNNDETNNDNSNNNRVLFSVDATKLEHLFPLQSLDRIIFNFPHWRGKSNNRYNRLLLDDFLRSASRVLKREDENSDPSSSSNYSSGEIHVALCEKQGGADAETLVEWRGSWMAHAYAAEHGLVLRRLEPFSACYDLSSHRGVDRTFPVGKRPLTYVFGWPSQSSADKNNNDDNDDIENDDPRLKIGFRHELRLVMDPIKLLQCGFTQNDLEHSDVVPELVRQVTPEGIDCEVPLCSLVLPQKMAHPMLVFLVVYRSSLQRPLTRSVADRIRSELEEAATKRFGLDIAKRDRMVSKPFPYPILNTLIKDL